MFALTWLDRVMVMASFRCCDNPDNPDRDLFSPLTNTAVVAIYFQIFVKSDFGSAQTRKVLTQKKTIESP